MAITCASNILCDIINKGCELMDTLFKEIKNKEGLWRIKRITMAQWINVNWNNRFVNPQPLPWLSEISGAIHLALLGLMAGRQVASRQTKCRWILKILKLAVDQNIQLFALFNQDTPSLQQYQCIPGAFRVKSIARLFFKV